MYDLFMGSSTTGVACVQAGKRFIGIEQDELYFIHAYERIRKACNVSESDAAAMVRPPYPRLLLRFLDVDHIHDRRILQQITVGVLAHLGDAEELLSQQTVVDWPQVAASDDHFQAGHVFQDGGLPVASLRSDGAHSGHASQA